MIEGPGICSQFSGENAKAPVSFSENLPCDLGRPGTEEGVELALADLEVRSGGRCGNCAEGGWKIQGDVPLGSQGSVRQRTLYGLGYFVK